MTFKTKQEELEWWRKISNSLFVKGISGFRADLNMTRLQLASKVNVSESLIEQWESGKLMPTQTQLDRLRQIFGSHLKKQMESLKGATIKRTGYPQAGTRG